MDVIFRIGVVGILVSFLVIILRQAQKDEWAQMVSITGAAVALYIVMRLVYDLFESVKTMFRLY